jgi:hypothetical protein
MIERHSNSSSHPRRTNHFKSNENSDFNSTSYSKEELVAEIEVAFLNNCTDILIDDT